MKYAPETKWFSGYKCEIAITYIVEGEWCGVVKVPRWHPVRLKSFGDHFVFLVGSTWDVFIEGYLTRLDALTNVDNIASRLRYMQDDWDGLSPYEREYVIR